MGFGKGSGLRLVTKVTRGSVPFENNFAVSKKFPMVGAGMISPLSTRLKSFSMVPKFLGAIVLARSRTVFLNLDIRDGSSFRSFNF